MSRGRRMSYVEAIEIAHELHPLIKPLCEEMVFAGSLRRRMAHVSDIEIVLRPFMQHDLLGEVTASTQELRHKLMEIGEWQKGGDRYMCVTDLLGRTGVGLDVFLVHPPAQWGSILAIRTGPAHLGQWCVTEMKKYDYRHVDGHVINTKTGDVHPTPDEESFFRCAGLDLYAPARRDEIWHQIQAKGTPASAQR